MKEQDKQKAIRGRDLFNKNITPLRDAYPTIRKVQDVMNRDINKAIYDVPVPPPLPPPPPPPTKPMLSPDLHYRKLRRIFSAFFLKGGLTLRTDLPNHKVLKHYTDQGFRDVIDRIAKDGLSNVIRVIGTANYAKEKGVDQHLAPHPVDSNGVFDLHTINKTWEDQARWRLEYMVERGLTVRYIFNDQSSVNGWFKHWLNQGNNHGWAGPTYDDRYGWFKWVHAETYTTEECTDERREWYRTTGEYIKWMRNYIVDNLLEPLGPYVIWDNNEVDAGSTWHNQEADFLSAVRLGKGRRITSVRGTEWFHTKDSIPARWMIECHGINSVQTYRDKLFFLRDYYAGHAPVTAPFLPSADGFGEKWINMGKDEVTKVLRKSLADGNLGFQGNSEMVWDNPDPKVYKIAEALRDVILEGR